MTVGSLSARRAWIEMEFMTWGAKKYAVALRKESVDRNLDNGIALIPHQVALRKESVDRNMPGKNLVNGIGLSLSARRAWIEIDVIRPAIDVFLVALRKESVDRNPGRQQAFNAVNTVALRKESVDRNALRGRIGA